MEGGGKRERERDRQCMPSPQALRSSVETKDSSMSNPKSFNLGQRMLVEVDSKPGDPPLSRYGVHGDAACPLYEGTWLLAGQDRVPNKESTRSLQS